MEEYLNRLQSLERELLNADKTGQLLVLIAADLAGLRFPHLVLQTIANANPATREALRSFLEGLHSLREEEACELTQPA